MPKLGFEKHELEVGKWYLPTEYPGYYFTPVDIHLGNSSISAYHFSGDSYHFFNEVRPISNTDFWLRCKEVELPENLLHLLPHHLRKPIINNNYSIF